MKTVSEINLELEDNEWPYTYTDHDRQIVRAIVFDENDFLKVNDEKEKLDINLPKKKCHWFCFNEPKGKIVLSVPADYENKIKIDSGYGTIKIGKFSNAKMDITADYGDITIGSVYDVVINEDYGDIEIGSIYNYLKMYFLI